VRSVTEDGEIQTTKAFVRQVVEKIQGVMEAKLTPAQPPPVTVLPGAYPGLSYQASSFYPVPYAKVYLPQAAYANSSVPQPSTAILRNVSDLATVNTPYTVKIYDTNRRCWTCNSEQHLSSSCPNKVPSTINTPQDI